ncbi:hypothetical protein LCGC14_0462080 [marine sediment metagenome]|uniref:Uncharacterized protein n=1 Tax=marine sediment metagenome TaxID=412755 RepID=A0A0F9SJY5_9ZZZZ
MKSKKGDSYGVLLFVLIIVLLLVLFLVRVASMDDKSSYQKYCEYEYGEYFLQSSDGEVFIRNPLRYCFSVNEEGDIEKHYFMEKQAKDICKKPNFFELNKWSVICGERGVNK